MHNNCCNFVSVPCFYRLWGVYVFRGKLLCRVIIFFMLTRMTIFRNPKKIQFSSSGRPREGCEQLIIAVYFKTVICTAESVCCKINSKPTLIFDHVSATTTHEPQKMWQQIVTTKCHYKLSQQNFTTNQNQIRCNSYVFICYGYPCKCIWNTVYFALMEVVNILSHFVALRVGKQSWHIICCHISFSQNVEVADACGTLPIFSAYKI